MHVTIPKPLFVTLLILLNMVPIYGVFAWGWKTFDLIYLYWLENLMIGLFATARFLLRRYGHPLELIPSLFAASFFVFHYGAFCYGHGLFIVALFGENIVADLSPPDTFENILPIVELRHLFWPVVALFVYQVLDWVRDINARDMGIVDIKAMMSAPYRRIVVLHIAIIGSGFLMMSTGEPVAGLLLLILLKTVFDFYHWRKDEQGLQLNPVLDNNSTVLDGRIKQSIDDMIDDLKITVNGQDVYFDSFEELQASKHYKTLRIITSLFGGYKKNKQIDAYITQRLAEKN